MSDNTSHFKLITNINIDIFQIAQQYYHEGYNRILS